MACRGTALLLLLLFSLIITYPTSPNILIRTLSLQLQRLSVPNIPTESNTDTDLGYSRNEKHDELTHKRSLTINHTLFKFIIVCLTTFSVAQTILPSNEWLISE
jgi:hypothetical protein